MVRVNMDQDLNAVVQIICTQAKPAFSHMVAGTGWFPNHEVVTNTVKEGILITNAHVVNGAEAVFIRLPCAHTTDIRVGVRSISTDLDIAVLQLDDTGLQAVKGFLRQRYGDDTIPTLRIADSDNLFTEETQNILVRGNPLGTEYQQFTRGTVSGLKHAHEQLYIVHNGNINPGNSGGPALNENGDAVGINTMKASGAELISMMIPSNRLVRALGVMMDNSDNERQIQTWMEIARAAYAPKHSNGNFVPSDEQINQVANIALHTTVDMDVILDAWDEHAIAGHKRGKNGKVEQVLFSEWFQKHVNNVVGGHEVFHSLLAHIENNDIDAAHEMRKNGFENNRCTYCAVSTSLKCSSVPGVRKINVSTMDIPPRVVHYPWLAFRISNSTGAPTLAYYGNPSGVQSGVVVSDVIDGGLMSRSNLKKDDFIYKIVTADGTKYEIDDYGESWESKLSVSLPISDIIHRNDFGSTVRLHVVRLVDNAPTKIALKINYDCLDHKYAKPVRQLDSLQDMGLARQMATIAGISVTPLRLNHVMQFNLGAYMNPHEQNKFKIVVQDLAVGSPAFYSKNIVPGDILKTVNDVPIAASWEGFVEQMKNVHDTVKLETERGVTLIL